jgi:hypothetical protein
LFDFKVRSLYESGLRDDRSVSSGFKGDRSISSGLTGDRSFIIYD